jgi:aryl-alcohol dehydrogenase-like predicted oxidoreductase
VAYSPLGRGFLTGALQRFEDLAEDDFRRTNPRFQGENFARNLRLVEEVKKMAAHHGCTPSQLALAWVMAQDPHIVPIPGTKRRRYLEENAGAFSVKLSSADLLALDKVFPRGAAAGERYAEVGMATLNR